MIRARMPWLAAVILAGMAAPLAAQTPAAPASSKGAPAKQAASASAPAAAPKLDPRIVKLKDAAAADVRSPELFTLGQQMVDMVFSFGELGFQEFETQKYLTGILKENGFTVETGVAGVPSSWVAKWGSGKPVIALGSDVDCIPQASQKPGVAYRDPIVAGAPGHGEGHNSGTPLNIVAAIAVKKLMEREKIPGTLVIWPGIAEEQLGTKAYYVRAGLFKDVDIVLYNHVGSELATFWGDPGMTGLVSVQYLFEGESAHSAGAPWRGRSALDAVELMDMGWNYRREHLRLQQRSHYVITDGGDQPNVVPRTASVWYYFRETNFDEIKKLWAIGDKMAEGAALMTNTKFTSRLLGSAWPAHMNKTIAETMYTNITAVGLPQWTEADLTLAKATQKELGVPEVGLAKSIANLRGQAELPDDAPRFGASDDVGDISWSVPTAMLSYPANFNAGPGHNWANAIAMATPIAHKGVNTGAQVQAMTIVDLLLRPELIQQARVYFDTVQTKTRKYEPLVRPGDQPATYLNKAIMERYRPEMKKFYYDPTKYKTYLEQLGITYPTVRTTSPTSPGDAQQAAKPD
jgi:aminobenzoyl-glutamate utilization protein B